MWQDGKRVGESGGQQLLQQVQQLAKDWELQNKFSIQGVECMSACSHACVIALQGEEKLTYLFGNLAVDDSASAILQCATQYYYSTRLILTGRGCSDPRLLREVGDL